LNVRTALALSASGCRLFALPLVGRTTLRALGRGRPPVGRIPFPLPAARRLVRLIVPAGAAALVVLPLA